MYFTHTAALNSRRQDRLTATRGSWPWSNGSCDVSAGLLGNADLYLLTSDTKCGDVSTPAPSPTLRSTAGSTTIRVSSSTIYLELASNPTGHVLSPTRRHPLQLATTPGPPVLLTNLLKFYDLLGWLTVPREVLYLLLPVHYEGYSSGTADGRSA